MLKHRVNNAARQLLDGLFPGSCLLCGLPCSSRLPLCTPCRRDLQANIRACQRCARPLASGAVCGPCLQHPPLFTRALVPWLYDPLLSALVRRWKDSGEQRLSPLLADLWLQQHPPPEVDLLVPVPLHWHRLWQRGYNQAVLLADALCRAHPALRDTPVLYRGARRRRDTASQRQLGARQRRHNLRHAFTVHAACDSLRCAIVDDVMTTGATASALAEALLDAGAHEVQLWCLARTPEPGD